MNKLQEIISKVAPVLGSVIPIPGASGIISLIANTLGCDTKEDSLCEAIENNPDAYIKLKEIEFNSSVQLHQIIANNSLEKMKADVEIQKATLLDVSNARSMSLTNKSHIQSCLVFILTFGMLGLIAYLCKSGISDDNQILWLLIGTLSTAWTQGINFFFGTSAASAKKDDMLWNSVPANKKLTKEVNNG